MIIGTVEPEFPFVDGARRKDVLKLKDYVRWNMGNYVVSPKRIGRMVDVRMIDIVSAVHRAPAGEHIVEPDHHGIFANGIVGYFGDLVSDAVNWRPTRRVRVEDRREYRRRGQRARAKCRVRYEVDERLAETLA